ncbi:MAG: ATP-binding protein [Desulfuromonadaceae bacterium]|nr:ATP-binding protein [Desulfuromonadaceae bacterium]
MGISKENSLSAAATELRYRAEEQLRAEKGELHPSLTGEAAKRLVQELELHQIELEMQNAELHQTRNEMEMALEMCTDLYEFSPAGYFTIDRNGTIRAANLSGATLLGIERSLLLGRHFGSLIAYEARQLFADFLGKLCLSQGNESCELEITRVENSPLFLYIEAAAFESGEECRITVIDITERRRAEDALAEKRRELEEINSSLELRIAQALEELRQKDQILILRDRQALMGEMINNIAHQWRQPLNALGLMIQQLPIYYGSAEFNREFLEENTGKSMDLIMHMSRTIDDFRNFFRSDKQAVTFSANQVIARTLPLIEMSSQEQQIKITLDPEGDPIVNGYPNEYAQVLLNILMNARDALVEQKPGDALISIRTFVEEGKTVVTVSDNAGGIADDIIDKIFDPYFTTKGPDKGTGIGLFMSRNIIEKSMGGRLTAQNSGNGAEFRIEV